jgi:DNA-binding NarL/FixJ family response regulator
VSGKFSREEQDAARAQARRLLGGRIAGILKRANSAQQRHLKQRLLLEGQTTFRAKHNNMYKKSISQSLFTAKSERPLSLTPRELQIKSA